MTQNRTVSNKLSDLMSDLKAVLARKALKPSELIEIGKAVEKGEKNIRKEYRKLNDILEQVKFEIAEIETFSARMGYNLNPTEQSESTETEQENTEEEHHD